MSTKTIFWPVIISIFIHMTLLAVTGMIDLRDNIKPVEIFSVSIKEPDREMETTPEQKEEIKTKREAKSVRTQKEKGIDTDDWHEDTVDLGSTDIKYVAYLAKVKKKIFQIEYPRNAYKKNEEGNVIVKMSIDANGRLAGSTILSSSGYVELDNGALSAVQAATPFAPLPGIYNLSRLHINVTFLYKLRD